MHLLPFSNHSEMRYLLVVALSIFTFSLLYAQDTYWKILDMSGDASEEPWDMEIRNDTVFIWGRGTCNDASCLHYYQLNREGEILLQRSYPEIYPLRRVDMQDSYFFLPIRLLDEGITSFQSFRLGKFDIKTGDLIQSEKYDLNDFENSPEFEADIYYSYGCVKYGSHIVVYGDLVDVDEVTDTEKWQTCMFWYDEKDLSLDTIIFVEPKENTHDTWDAAIDKNGLLTLLIEYRIQAVAGASDHFLVYVKYDEAGNMVEFWDGPEWSGRYIHNPLLITEDNRIVIPYEDRDRTGIKVVRNIQEDGVISWDEPLGLNTVAIGDFGYLDLIESQDGNLVGSGGAFSGIAWFNGAYVFKLDKDSGEVIWQRAYIDWRGEEFEGSSTANTMFLFNIGQFSDGSYFTAGIRRRNIENNGVTRSVSDLLIMRLDEDGCLEPDCGGLKQDLIGEPAYDYMLSPESHWYYNDTDFENNIIKYTFFYWNLLPDTTFAHLWSEQYLDIREDDDYEHTTGEVFRLEDGGKKVVYTGDGKDELIYDFTLDVGDVFETEYIDQALIVIDSDTIILSDKSKMRYWELACTENPDNTIIWYEKMGTYQGVLWPRDFCSGDYGNRTLNCFYRYEQLAHMNPEVDDCLMPNSTDDLTYLQLSAISAYPNPTQDHLTISATDDLHITRTELLDLQGRTHTRFHEHSSEVMLDLSGYPSGLYFVSIHTDKGAVVKKVVVE